MFDHPIIDVGLGMIFFYVVLSLVASSVQEWISSLLSTRSKNLQQGVQNLLGNEYAKKVYEHPLIDRLSKDKKLPSYISTETLSSVLLEVIAKEQDSGPYQTLGENDVKDLIEKIDDDHPLKEILKTMVSNGSDLATELKQRLAGWFDEGMSRVGGWYARQVKYRIFIIACIFTIVLNASSVHMVEELWQNDALRIQIASHAQKSAQASEIMELEDGIFESLETFPIGWRSFSLSFSEIFKTVLGWIITIAAVSLGAPFWFDLLGKVANLRGSGKQVQTPNSQ